MRNFAAHLASQASAFGFFGMLALALKLLGKVDWPWYMVLAPFWALPAIFTVLTLMFLAGDGIVWVFSTPEQRARNVAERQAFLALQMAIVEDAQAYEFSQDDIPTDRLDAPEGSRESLPSSHDSEALSSPCP